MRKGSYVRKIEQISTWSARPGSISEGCRSSTCNISMLKEKKQKRLCTCANFVYGNIPELVPQDPAQAFHY